MTNPTLTYSAWGLPGGKADTFTRGADRPAWLEQDSILLYTIEATNHNDAMRQYHERQGWEPYRPMPNGAGT